MSVYKAVAWIFISFNLLSCGPPLRRVQRRCQLWLHCHLVGTLIPSKRMTHSKVTSPTTAGYLPPPWGNVLLKDSELNIANISTVWCKSRNGGDWDERDVPTRVRNRFPHSCLGASVSGQRTIPGPEELTQPPEERILFYLKLLYSRSPEPEPQRGKISNKFITELYSPRDRKHLQSEHQAITGPGPSVP